MVTNLKLVLLGNQDKQELNVENEKSKSEEGNKNIQNEEEQKSESQPNNFKDKDLEYDEKECCICFASKIQIVLPCLVFNF